jgi:hypothetical protein
MEVTSNRQLINAVTLTTTATTSSVWVPCNIAESTMTLYLLIASGATTPHVGVYFDYSPFTVNQNTNLLTGGGKTLAYTAADATMYATLTIVSDCTTTGSLVAYTIQSPSFSQSTSALADAFCSYRVRFVGGASNGSSIVSAWMTLAG